MATRVEAPPATAEENALRTEQTNLLRSQREILLDQQKMQKSLLPMFASQMGITLKYDKTGNIIGATQDPKAKYLSGLQQQVTEKSLNDILHPENNPAYVKQQKLLDMQLAKYEDEINGPQAIQNKEIQKLLGEKTLKALKGELDVDPALERDIKTQGDTLKDRLRSQLGSGFETSSAGIEALQKFGEGAEVLRSQARHGELTLAEQLSMARQGVDLATGQSAIQATQARLPGIDPISAGGFAFGLGQGQQQSSASLRQILGGDLAIAGGLGQVASGFQMPIGQLQNTRNMELNANIQNAQNNMAGIGALGSVFGAVLGMSDSRLKYDIEPIGEYEGIPIYAYTMIYNGIRKVGVMAQDLLRIKPELVSQYHGFLRVNYGEL